MKRLSLGLLVAASACAPPAVSSITLATPEVVACDNAPSEVRARAWQSGLAEPTALEVADDGTTSGSLTVRTGLVRQIVVDWLVVVDDTEVLIGQARGSVDLTAPEEDTATLSFGEEDVTVTAMVDVEGDLSLTGAATVERGDAIVPVADLNASCEGEVEVDCSNLGDICAGRNPL